MRIALYFLVGVSALPICSTAYAQSSSEQESQSEAAPDTLDIIVTGSRIRGVAPVGSSLINVGRDAVIGSGATTTADVLREVPQITSLGINAEGAQGAAAPSNISRATAPNLRGIGPTATLTILDGHRVSTAGTQGQLVDPSFLPTLALERVEVIADGASAIYGSDAVAGVINLIPRKGFDGAEVSYRVGAADGYWDYQVAGIVGGGWNGGHAVFAIDHVWNSALTGSERDFVSDDRRSFGGANGLVTTCARPGTLTIGGTAYQLPGGSGLGLQRSALSPGSNLCDNAKNLALLPEMKRTSMYGYVEQSLGAVKLFGQGFYSRRDSEAIQQITFNNVVIPATNPFRPLDVPAGTTLLFSGALADAPTTLSPVYAKTWQGIAGAEVNVGSFRLRGSGSIGQGKDQVSRRTLNNYNLARVLADSNPATALNLFAGPGLNNAGTVDAVLSGVDIIGGISKLKTAEFTIDGPLFTLPGGDVRIAAGGEYRTESLRGARTVTSAATGQPQAVSSYNERDVKAVYGELFIPFFGAGNATPGIQQLDISAAIRWEEYSDFGTTTNPKIGLNWVPVEGLTLRGSYGTSFRAPGLSENDPNSSGAGIYQFATVPLANGTFVTPVVLGGGNAGLKPETATTWSAGFDLAPEALNGLRLSGTYFDIRYKNQIVDGFGRVFQYLNDPAAYGQVAAFQGSPGFAALRDLIAGSGFVTTPPVDYTRSDLALVDARRINVGSVRARGIDGQISYRIDTATAGTFTLGANGTMFLEYATSEAGRPAVERKGTIAFPVEFQGRATIAWKLGGFSAQTSLQHIAGYDNTNSRLVPHVSSYQKIDLDLSYSFGADAGNFERNMRLGINVRNLFDRDPPQVDISNGYDATFASALGRIVAVTLSKAW